MSHLVSVLVPVYNAEAYIKKCLDSIQGQTFKDFEVICIDDGSTDQSGKICDEYAGRDERFCVYHQQNNGVAAARENALQKAAGKYIFWCDADDYVSPDWIEKVVSEFSATGVDIVRFSVQTFDNNGLVQLEKYPEAALHEMKKDAILGKNRSGSLWNYVALRKLWEKEVFSKRSAEDGNMTSKIFLKADRISVIPDVLYYRFFDNPNSLTHTDKRKWIKDFALWQYRRTLCRQYFPEEELFCRRNLLPSAVRAYCMSLLYDNLSAEEKDEIYTALEESGDCISFCGMRNRFLRWCILHHYLKPCRRYAIYKDKKQARQNRKLSRGGVRS